MAIPLLKTKLYIPPARTGLVSRPRLIERLNQGLRPGNKLILVSAPAGFGKTTLVSEWIAGCELRIQVAWLSLDEGDDDVARFWSYVISALQTLEPAIGQAALGALQDSQAQPPPLEPILTSLMNDIATHLPDDRLHVLILDDYHVLGGDAGDATTVASHAIHESLDSLLDHLPPALRLVIASREDPPLALSLLRGRGQLNEIRAADLRFTPAETAELLNAVMGLGLSAGDVAALEERTEGWAVGLHLAALSLQGRSALEAHDFVSAFAGDDRYVADYLLDQVLDRQPPHVQRFLIQTSILDRLCGPLCDALIAEQGTVMAAHGTVIAAQALPPDAAFAGSGEILEHLERSGLFVVPLDNRRHWYRYHHLFADLLRSRLQARAALFSDEEERGEVAALHLRASTWYEQEGWIAKAVDHALAAADYERAADMIQRYHRETIWPGEWTLVRRWLEALPDALIRSQPYLCLFYSLLALLDSAERAEEWLQAAEEALEAWEAQPQPLDIPGIPLSISARELFDANVLDIRTIIADLQGASSEEVIALTLQALERTPESVPSLRAAMFQRLGWCHLNLGEEGAAERFFRQAAELAEIGGHPGNILGATCGRALIAWRHGRLHDAATICRETLHSFVEPLERSGRRLPVAGDLYIYMGRILLELYALEEAESMLTKGVELAELTMRSGDLLDGYHALACLRCLEHDFEGAYAWMEAAERTCTWVPEGVRALWAWIWLWRARVEKDHQTLDLALEWARGRDVAHPADDDCELQSLAQAAIAGHRAYGKPDLSPLLCTLDEKLRQAKATDNADQKIQLLILQALALHAEGQMDPAIARLERALTLAVPLGYTLSFVRHGAPMVALLREAVARGIPVDDVDRLLSALAWEAIAPPSPPLVDRPPQQPLPEPLSKREREVLRLLSSTLTGPQIADQLSISVGTFRAHTKSIYGKLGVHSRIEAVERARDLDLA